MTSGVGPRLAVVHALRLSFVVALAIQLYALYLYVPGDANTPSMHLDKIVHAAIFALPAALGVVARFPLLLVGLALAAHAPVSELVQYLWLPARGGDAWDFVADWAGVVLGLAAGRLLMPRSQVTLPMGKKRA